MVQLDATNRKAEPPPSSPASASQALTIADLSILLSNSASGPDWKIQPPNSRFVTTPARPDLTVTASYGDSRSFDWGEQIFDSGGLWQLFSRDGRFVFRFASPVLGFNPYRWGEFDSDFGTGRIWLHSRLRYHQPGFYPLEYPLDELLVLNWLARGRGAEIHACGVLDRSGDGYLFAGQSGAGKTTMAQLWMAQQGITVLSDDRVIVRLRDGLPWIHGTPWCGRGGQVHPGRGRLKGIFFLRHGRQDQIISQPSCEATARLFSCCFPPFYHRQGLDFTLNFLAQLAETVPCYELRFVPQPPVKDLVRRAVQ